MSRKTRSPMVLEREEFIKRLISNLSVGSFELINLYNKKYEKEKRMFGAFNTHFYRVLKELDIKDRRYSITFVSTDEYENFGLIYDAGSSEQFYYKILRLI